MATQKDFTDDVVVCYLSKSGDVLDKSSACMELCGRGPNQPCTHFSRKPSNLNFSENGFYRGPTVAISNGRFADTVFLIADKNNVVLHHLVNSTWQEWNRKIANSDLTASEQEIAALLLARFSNDSVCDLKKISSATLKTHINKIYQKIPGFFDWRSRQDTYELNPKPNATS